MGRLSSTRTIQLYNKPTCKFLKVEYWNKEFLLMDRLSLTGKVGFLFDNFETELGSYPGMEYCSVIL